MDETKDISAMEQEQPMVEEDEGYVSRPRWQVWGARIGLVIFLLFVALQILQIAGGGL